MSFLCGFILQSFSDGWYRLAYVIWYSNEADVMLPWFIDFIRYLQVYRHGNVTSGFLTYHLIERAFGLDAVWHHPHEKSVPKCLQTFVLGRKFVAGSNQSLHWQRQSVAPILEDTFIDGCQQDVLYGRTGFPYLVQEHDRCRRQESVHDTLVSILILQKRDRNGTKDFIGCGKSWHQVFKGITVFESQFQPTCD